MNTTWVQSLNEIESRFFGNDMYHTMAISMINWLCNINLIIKGGSVKHIYMYGTL